MASEPLPWSEGAKTVVSALRGRADADGVIWTTHALQAILFGTPVDSSLLSRALREDSLWPGLDSFMRGMMTASGLGAVHLLFWGGSGPGRYSL